VVVPAQAADLDARFATMWEILWTQSGATTQLVRWGDEIRVRFTGTAAGAHRDYLFVALGEAAAIADVRVRDVTAEPRASKLANLEIRLVDDHDLPARTPCTTTHEFWQNWMFQSVLMRARPQAIRSCARHEMMHVMGIRGHPAGMSVLSYFTQARDRLMPMDEVILKAWYAPRMPLGATPFEALQVLTEAVVEASAAPHEREAAMAARARFLSSTLAAMERYASGEGEVPPVVVRSGHAAEKTIGAGRNLMAYFVGVAHLQGIGTAQDRASARKWLLRAADGGSMSARATLARLQAAEN
jgi:hypothetical protein